MTADGAEIRLRRGQIEQVLLQGRRGAEGNLRQHPGVEPERNSRNAAEHRDAQSAPNPLTGPERALHRREDAPADQQGDGQRCRRAGRIGQQQQSRLGIGALKYRPGQHEPENWPGTRRP